MTRPTRIAVDWDGTLADEVWPGIGDWKPGAVEALKCLAKMYDEVVIFTLRLAPFEVDETTPRSNLDQISLINRKLEQEKIPYNVRLWTKPYKPPCEFFIDDRNVEFDGSWEKALAKVGVRRVTNRKREEQMAHYGEYVDQDSFGCCGDSGDCICKQEQAVEEDRAAMAISPDWNPGVAWQVEEPKGEMRQFGTGATRNVEVDPDYHGFFSPLAMHAYGEYMHAHRLQADGSMRASDNWQLGMPRDSYVRSLVRHTHDVELIHDGYGELARSDPRDPDKLKAHLGAIIFNAQGLLHELMKAELSLEGAVA